MGGLLTELGKKLAERWLSLLVLPGALYLAVAAVAITLGHGHALDFARLGRELTAHAKDPAVATAGGQVVLLAAALGAAAAIGLIAQAVGSGGERLVLAAGWSGWPAPLRQLAGWRTARRQRRWDRADVAFTSLQRQALAPDPRDRPDPAERRRAAARRDRIAVERSERPTWSGDRIHAAALRLDSRHHLDLATLWPHLWLVLPDPVRVEVAAARAAMTRATTLAGWALLYAALAWWWWPAGLVALVLAATSRHRVRATADSYAGLLEATARLYSTALATQLGIAHTGPLTADLGDALTRHLSRRQD